MEIKLYQALTTQLMQLLLNPYIHIFIWGILVDILTGYIKAFITQTADSSIGLKGLIKHVLVLFLVLLSFLYLQWLGLKTYAQTILIFYFVNYALSIVENLSAIGVPIPEFIRKYLNQTPKK